MATLVQRSFSGGEISPSLYARVDTTKYATGLRTCRNMLVMRHGGAQNRPGSIFVCEAEDSTKSVRLIPFVFNSSQTYVLEFGDQYIRVIKDGVQLKETAKNIAGATNASACELTINTHGYTTGDEIYVSGIVGAIGNYLNNRNFKVVNTGANTITLKYMNGVDVDSTLFGGYTSGGTAEKVYQISSPYLEADLFDLQYVQSADVVTIVHPDYAPRELSRSGDTSWTLSTITFDPSISGPTNGAVSHAGAGGSVGARYKVTAVKEGTFEESLPGTDTARVITNITQTNPAVITTSAPHGFVTGDIYYISGVVGMTEVNGGPYRITSPAGSSFQLRDIDNNLIDSTGFTAYSSGGSAIRNHLGISGRAAPTTATPFVLTWTAVSGATEYIIYKEENGIYGYIGTAGSPEFDDVGLEPDLLDTPPIDNELFEQAGDYPSAVTYVQQRRGFGNTDNDPEKIWLSKIGNFNNFTSRSPMQDDDSVNFILAGRQVNSIKHMIDIGRLVVFTSGGEWSIEGDAAGTITATDVNPRQYGYNGSANLPPLVIGGNALFVQARGSVIRDLAFDDTVQSYRGNDLTIFSSHLFDEYVLNDWAFQQIPNSIVWVVRSDGVLLGLTYVREHEMWAWHRHDFDDAVVESVAVVPDGNEDALYLVLRRTVDGRTVRYIEFLATRQVSEALIKDAIFMDSTLSYDGRHTGSTTMTLSGGTNWTFDETLTLTASAGTFSASDVGNQIHMTGSDGTLIRFTIDAYSSSTVVTGRPNKTVPVAMRSVAVSEWATAVDTLQGLWHLEGKDVSVFADGFVVANPNNDAYVTVTVTDGSITLDKPYSVIHVGLPYISDIETLDIDTPQGETLADKHKIVNKVSVFVEKSRGIWAGASAPTGDDPLDGLYELKIRESESYDLPVALQTGVVDINIRPEWSSHGRVFIRQVDPVPLSVLAIAPAGLFPIRG